MFEDDNVDNTAQDIVQELAPEVEVAPQPAIDPKEEAAERNYVALRQLKEQAERERDEYARRLQVEQQQKQKPAPVEEEPDFNVPDDDYIEAKHVKKVYAKLRDVEKRLAQQQQQSTESVVDVRLKSEFPDFAKVTTQENLQAFAHEYPEMAATIHNSTGDLYSKAVTAYTMIKKFDIYKEDIYAQDRELVQRNAAKPKPSAAISAQQGDTALSKAGDYTNGPISAEMRNKIYQQARKNAGLL